MASDDVFELSRVVAQATKTGEDFDWQDWFELTIDIEDKEQVVALWLQLHELASSIKALLGSMGPDLAKMLVTQGSVSLGDSLVYAKPKRKEECVDAAGFFEWLDGVGLPPERLFNANAVRKGQLPKEARDTFFKTTYEDEVTVVVAAKEFMRP